MRLTSLSLLNFKNIAQAEIDLSEPIGCFTGGNGAGKTNIIDAVHYLSMCKSALQMTDGQCVRHGEEFFMVSGSYTTDGGKQISAVCSFKRGEGKVMKYCGKDYQRLADHIGILPVVIVSPSDISLVSDAAEERRRQLNAFISQADRTYLDSVMRYNRLLAERNTLLKAGESGPADLLDVLDDRLAEAGEAIASVRRDIIGHLKPLVAEFYAFISGDSEEVELSYRSELNEAPMTDILRRSRSKDFALGFSSSGIHRDDLVMTIGGYPLRKYGSQGQQKSFLIALKLAQYALLAERSGERPILLFDDLFDRLDSERLGKLIELASGERFGQMLITDCDGERMAEVLRRSGRKFRLFDVSGGEVAARSL